MMNQYKITAVDEVTRIYYVEAESREHALRWDCDIVDVKEIGTESGVFLGIEADI